jgi:hypothetical protein
VGSWCWISDGVVVGKAGKRSECSNGLLNDYDTQDIYSTTILLRRVSYIETPVLDSQSIAFWHLRCPD